MNPEISPMTEVDAIMLTRDLEGKYYVEKRSPLWHKLLNITLGLFSISLAIYILFFPVLPEIQYRLTASSRKIPLYKGALGNEYLSESKKSTQKSIIDTLIGVGEDAKASDLRPIPSENTLFIPQIGADGKVFEGNSNATLNKGFWRRPKSSTPDKGGNTVIVAHRFLYTAGPKTFYNLDKMEVGDKFALYWEGKEYNYEVFEVTIVAPTAVEIEGYSDEAMVTLYTCTPLWTAKDRLVVKAKLISS